jgi:DNA-binding SARP family transcriptional activator
VGNIGGPLQRRFSGLSSQFHARLNAVQRGSIGIQPLAAQSFRRFVDREFERRFRRWTSAAASRIESAAKVSAENGRLDEAAEHWHRLTRIDPANSRIATSYMNTLAALGDRSAALAHGRAHADYLRREFEAEPDVSFHQSFTRLRDLKTAEMPAVQRLPTEETEEIEEIGVRPHLEIANWGQTPITSGQDGHGKRDRRHVMLGRRRLVRRFRNHAS